MLAELHVRDLALIDEVWLELEPGFTVLTGETGAGKTVLVSALKLLLGERADSTLVREGADEALVEGRFVVEDDELVVRRRVSNEGRSRCAIAGEMATVSTLADVLGPLVDLHGQHDHQALLVPARHAEYLDRFVGRKAGKAAARYRAAWEKAATARARLGDLEAALDERDQRADYLRFVLGDIDAVAPRAGEDEELAAMLPRLQHAERLAEAASAAWTALKGEHGVSDSLSEALSALSAARGLDPELDRLAEAVGELDIEAQEVASSILSYAETIERDPAALDAAQDRLHALEGLSRKYGGSLDAVIEARSKAARELETLESSEAALAKAREALEEAEAQLREAGRAWMSLRASAIEPFTASLHEAAAELALPKASFAVARTALPFERWTAEGPERLEFLFSPGLGQTPRPLARIASGGEVSRVMLALKSVLGDADSVPVLVFDEIDAGIGGKTARAVGARLAALSSQRQVLAITHLAQVAAYADHHIVVRKEEREGRVVTRVASVTGERRVAELARMLAGDVSATSLAHARELLDSVSETPSRKQS